MRVAVLGVKDDNSLDKFRKEVRSIFRKLKIKPDESYFDTPSEEDRLQGKGVFKKLEKLIFYNDVIIVESTAHSTGIGLIIGAALAQNRPILVLHRKNAKNRVSANVLSASKDSPRVFLAKYTSDDLPSHIYEFLGKAKDLIIAKFYMYLPPEKNRYLEWWASHHQQPKVDLIRKLLDEKIESDKEFTKYMKEPIIN